MRLQKQLSRRIGKIEYAKYVIVIPSEAIKQAGWKEGEELKIMIEGKKLIICPS